MADNYKIDKYIGATNIQELADALTKYHYTPRTDEQRRAEAEAAYALQRDQALRSALQSYQESDLALQNQLVGLADSYNRQIEDQNKNTAQNISAADRRALGRGMQRSTYNNSTLNNLQLQGDKAVAQIQQNRTNDETKVANQRALLMQKYQQAMAAAESDFERNVIQRQFELADQDYQRQVAADQYINETQLKLYAQQQAERQFEEQMGLERDKFGESQRQFNLNFGENQRQFDANLGENRRQFDATNALNRDKLAEDQRQFNANFGENQRQFNITNNYNQARLAEEQRQFDQNLGYQRERGAASDALSREQMAASLNELNLKLALEREQMAQNQSQFDEDLWFKRQQAGLPWSTAEEGKAAAAAAANGTGAGADTAALDAAVGKFGNGGIGMIDKATRAGMGTGDTWSYRDRDGNWVGDDHTIRGYYNSNGVWIGNVSQSDAEAGGTIPAGEGSYARKIKELSKTGPGKKPSSQKQQNSTLTARDTLWTRDYGSGYTGSTLAEAMDAKRANDRINHNYVAMDPNRTLYERTSPTSNGQSGIPSPSVLNTTTTTNLRRR